MPLRFAVSAALLGAAILLVAPGAARADGWETCVQQEGITHDQQIAGCTEVIESGVWTGDNLALAYKIRGSAHADKDNWSGTIADLDRALALTPKDAWALNTRCWARAMLNRELDKALADCDAALALVPGSPPILDSRGYVHLRAGRWDAAIADFDAALDAAPKLSWALYGRGLAKLRKGDKTGQADLDAGLAAWSGIRDELAKVGLAR